MRAHRSLGRQRAWRLALTHRAARECPAGLDGPGGGREPAAGPGRSVAGPSPARGASAQRGAGARPAPTAEVTFATPQRFAIVSEPRARPGACIPGGISCRIRTRRGTGSSWTRSNPTACWSAIPGASRSCGSRWGA